MKTVAAQLNSVDSTKNLPSDFSEKLINVELKRFDLLIEIIKAVDSVNSTEELADKLYVDIINEQLSPAYREEYPVLGLGGIVKVGTKYPEEN